MPRVNAQPVRLSSELLEQVKEAARTSGRTVPMEIEHRVRQTLEARSEREIEGSLSPWALAVGRLARLLANEIAAYSRPDERTARLKVALAKLLDHLGGDAKLKLEARGQAEDFAEFLWLKFVNAHEHTAEAGEQMPLTAEQQELVAIREVLQPRPSRPHRE